MCRCNDSRCYPRQSRIQQLCVVTTKSPPSQFVNSSEVGASISTAVSGLHLRTWRTTSPARRACLMVLMYPQSISQNIILQWLISSVSQKVAGLVWWLQVNNDSCVVDDLMTQNTAEKILRLSVCCCCQSICWVYWDLHWETTPKLFAPVICHFWKILSFRRRWMRRHSLDFSEKRHAEACWVTTPDFLVPLALWDYSFCVRKLLLCRTKNKQILILTVKVDSVSK